MLILNELAIPGNGPLLRWLVALGTDVDLALLRTTFAVFDPRLFPLQALACAWWRYGRKSRAMALGNCRGALREMLLCALCFVATVAGIGLVKLGFNAPRPALLFADLVPRLPAGDPYGFPSGHAAIATAAAFLLWPCVGIGGRAALVLLAGWVMVARCLAGLHFPFDVLVGAAIALASCAAVNRVMSARTR